MKGAILSFIFVFSILAGYSQNKERFSIGVNYGLNGNFFVGSYDELSPSGEVSLLKKNFIGTIAGLQFSYKIGKNSNLGIAYNRSINKGKKNYHAIINGVDIFVEDFNIRHVNNFYELFYEHGFSKKTMDWSYHAGVFLLSSAQQEIEFDNFLQAAFVQERNYQNSGLSEGGVFAGLQYSKKIDTRFRLGLKTRVYYLISTGSFEAISLTPTLSYYF